MSKTPKGSASKRRSAGGGRAHWLQCAACSCSFAPADDGAHKRCCPPPSGGSLVDEPHQWHAFVHDGTLVCTVKACGGSSPSSPSVSWSSSHCVYVQAEALRQLNAAYGSAAVLSSVAADGRPSVAIARLYSAQEGADGHAAIATKLARGRALASDGLVRILTGGASAVQTTVACIRPVTGVISAASSVHLRAAASQCDKSFFASDAWRAFLRGYMGDGVVAAGVPLCARYFGQTVLLSPVDHALGQGAAAAAHSDVADTLQPSLQPNEEVQLGNDGLDISQQLDSIQLDDSSSACTETPKSKSDKAPVPFTMPHWGDSWPYAHVVATLLHVQHGADVVFDTSVPQDEHDAQAEQGFATVGGLSSAMESLHACVLSAFGAGARRSSRCLGARTVLLHGPTGCGKTTLLRALRHEVHAVGAAARFVDDVALFLQKGTTSGSDRLPADVLLLDDVDHALGAQHDGGDVGSGERAAAAKLAKLLDTAADMDTHACIVASSGAPERLSAPLRRRFDVEIEAAAPNEHERAHILRKALARYRVAGIDDIFVDSIAKDAHGYTGGDLASASRQCVSLCRGRGGHSPNASDLRAALRRTRPSALREITLEVPHVRWDDIGGYDHVKLLFRQAVEWPLAHPDAFARLGARPPAGILLYGPPGCCKTLMARALATESSLNFLAVKGPELFSKWVGESERAVRRLFAKARQAAPAIVFFDEIDAIAMRRGTESGAGSAVGDRVLTQLLTEMDGLESLSGVTVVAATNRPETIDRALVRPGRLDRAIYVPLPDSNARMQIIDICRKSTPTSDDFDADWLMSSTAGYSGAEIVSVFREAALTAMRRDLAAAVCTVDDFVDALSVVPPRTDVDALKLYERFAKATDMG